MKNKKHGRGVPRDAEMAVLDLQIRELQAKKALVQRKGEAEQCKRDLECRVAAARADLMRLQQGVTAKHQEVAKLETELEAACAGLTAIGHQVDGISMASGGSASGSGPSGGNAGASAAATPRATEQGPQLQRAANSIKVVLNTGAKVTTTPQAVPVNRTHDQREAKRAATDGGAPAAAAATPPGSVSSVRPSNSSMGGGSTGQPSTARNRGRSSGTAKAEAELEAAAAALGALGDAVAPQAEAIGDHSSPAAGRSSGGVKGRNRGGGRGSGRGPNNDAVAATVLSPQDVATAAAAAAAMPPRFRIPGEVLEPVLHNITDRIQMYVPAAATARLFGRDEDGKMRARPNPVAFIAEEVQEDGSYRKLLGPMAVLLRPSEREAKGLGTKGSGTMELTGTGWALLRRELRLQHWDTVGLYTDEEDVVHIFKAADGAADRLKAFRKAEKSASARAAEAERQELKDEVAAIEAATAAAARRRMRGDELVTSGPLAMQA